MITGEYTELIENERIVMKWRMKDWKADDYSVVEIAYNDGGDNNCEL